MLRSDPLRRAAAFLHVSRFVGWRVVAAAFIPVLSGRRHRALEIFEAWRGKPASTVPSHVISYNGISNFRSRGRALVPPMPRVLRRPCKEIAGTAHYVAPNDFFISLLDHAFSMGRKIPDVLS